MLAHISTEYYVRLEQARAPQPSADVLAGIARALRLSEAESDHLHLLAGAVSKRSLRHTREVRPSILALLERVPAAAGIVVSAAFDVLAWNDLAIALMEDFSAKPPRDRNLARRAFLPDIPEDALLYGISDATEFREQVVIGLRNALTRYPEDAYIRELVEDLRTESPLFARLWELRVVQPAVMLTKTFEHPVIGSIALDCDVLHLADRDQDLVLYTAPNGSNAAQSLAFLETLGQGGISVN